MDRASAGFSVWAALAVLAALVALTISVAVSDVITAREPSYSGTFTLTYVDDVGRGPDIYYGYWVSDDGSTRLPEVTLDGALNPARQANAIYRPADLLNAVGVPTVRTKSRQETRSVLPWLGCAAITTVSFIAFRVTRGIRREKREEAAARAAAEEPDR